MSKSLSPKSKAFTILQNQAALETNTFTLTKALGQLSFADIKIYNSLKMLESVDPLHKNIVDAKAIYNMRKAMYKSEAPVHAMNSLQAIREGNLWKREFKNLQNKESLKDENILLNSLTIIERSTIEEIVKNMHPWTINFDSLRNPLLYHLPRQKLLFIVFPENVSIGSRRTILKICREIYTNGGILHTHKYPQKVVCHVFLFELDSKLRINSSRKASE